MVHEVPYWRENAGIALLSVLSNNSDNIGINVEPDAMILAACDIDITSLPWYCTLWVCLACSLRAKYGLMTFRDSKSQESPS